MRLSTERLLPVRLDIDLNAHLVADDGRRFDHLAVQQVEIPPVDLRLRRRAHLHAAVRPLQNGRWAVDVEGDLLRHAVHREIPDEPEAAFTGRLDALGLERDGRILRHIEEAVRSQVAIAVLLTGVDAVHVYRDVGRDAL